MEREGTSLASVVRQCLETGGPDAWAALIHFVQPLFARIAYRVANEWSHPTAQDLDDVVQDIYLKLFANRCEALRKVPLSSEQSALAYLKVTAANCARDHFRTVYAGKRDLRKNVDTCDENTRLDIFANAQRGIERSVLLRQLDNNLEADSRNRAIFWLYYRDGFSAREIAEISSFGLTIKGVESVLHQLTTSLRDKVDSMQTGVITKGNSADATS